jgi:hypothetical protein
MLMHSALPPYDAIEYATVSSTWQKLAIWLNDPFITRYGSYSSYISSQARLDSETHWLTFKF